MSFSHSRRGQGRRASLDVEAFAAANGGRITGVKVRSGRSDRTVVCLDEEVRFEIATSLADEHRLRAGMDLTGEQVGVLLREDQPFLARSRSLTALSVKDRHSCEIRSRLQEEGFRDEVIDATIVWLVERGYLDDARFTERFVSEKTRGGWGERRIQSELLRKGIDRTEAAAATEAGKNGSESRTEAEQQLVALVVDRFGRLHREDPAAAERRATGFLARRGHDWETIRLVMDKLRRFEAEGDPPDGGDSE